MTELLIDHSPYTELAGQGKEAMSLILQVRQQLTRFWLRTIGPRWTVGCLVLLRDEEGRICFLRHKGRVKPWGLPGGLMQWPEGPLDALRRELLEELGWCSSGRLVLRETLTSDAFPLVELVFEAEVRVSGFEKSQWILQATEIDEALWLTAHEVERHEGILFRHKSVVARLLQTG